MGSKRVGIRGALTDESCAGKYVFPLKVVFAVEQFQISIMSAYPLKKGIPK